jgi:Undecaprenyl-phosphate glucose phosphotransferase
MSDAPTNRIHDFAPGQATTRSMGASTGRIRPRRLELALGLADLATIVVTMVLSALIYHLSAVSEVFRWPLYVFTALSVGLSLTLVAELRGHYAVRNAEIGDVNAISAFYLFNIVFAIFVCLLFMSKMTDIYSRATLALQYGTTSVALLATRVVASHIVARAVAQGRIAARRVALVGSSSAIVHHLARRSPRDGLSFATTVELPDWVVEPLGAERQEDLDKIGGNITASLRDTRIDDVLILLPWSAAQAVEILAKRLTALPATIQLLPDSNLSWFRAPALTRIGSDVALSLSRPPLTAFDRAAKRSVDMVLAALILIAVAPLMLMIAVAIVAETGGPVLFRQKRHGFNEEPFDILKFRSMTTADNGESIVQATAADLRVTAVGRILRRSSLDELPQLINVLKGDMSLVGPRPHAVAHTLEYERKIAFYAHRHNVKPGLTGWAQVNGFRGETDEPWKMEKRIEYDLYYIDNWSLVFDLKILALTVLSDRTFKNAY